MTTRATETKEPDYIYDTEEWEATFPYGDRDDIVNGVDLSWGEIHRFSTLHNGPDKFAAQVPNEMSEDGEEIMDAELRWFDSEQEARDAIDKAKGFPAPPSLSKPSSGGPT
jgi:hypothetical protein